MWRSGLDTDVFKNVLTRHDRDLAYCVKGKDKLSGS